MSQSPRTPLVFYQRRSRPPPPDRSPCGFALLTVRARPWSSYPLKRSIAACASWSFPISTKPKPRDCPENLSVTMFTEATVPAWPKSASRSGTVTLNERLPTYNFVAIITPLRTKRPRKYEKVPRGLIFFEPTQCDERNKLNNAGTLPDRYPKDKPAACTRSALSGQRSIFLKILPHLSKAALLVIPQLIQRVAVLAAIHTVIARVTTVHAVALDAQPMLHAGGDIPPLLYAHPAGRAGGQADPLSTSWAGIKAGRGWGGVEILVGEQRPP